MYLVYVYIERFDYLSCSIIFVREYTSVFMSNLNLCFVVIIQLLLFTVFSQFNARPRDVAIRIFGSYFNCHFDIYFGIQP